MSIQSEVFNTVLKKKQKRSTFDLSHDVKMSMDMGKLVPMYLQECVPGDKINIQSHSMIRFAPLISPVMHRVQVKMEYFFVPNRILWNDWETFITGSRNGKALAAEDLPVFPQFQPWGTGGLIPQSKVSSGSLLDYLGFPSINAFAGQGQGFLTSERFSMLPLAAYQRIYDEFYRDENLQESVYDMDLINVPSEKCFEDYNSLISKDYSGVNIGNNFDNIFFDLRDRAWQHDYFTSALPFAQKGQAVEIPLSTEDLRISGALGYDPSVQSKVVNSDDPDTTAVGTLESDGAAGSGQIGLLEDSLGQRIGIDNSGALTTGGLTITNVDGTDTFLSTINDLRTAIKLQEWLETNARGGTRYIESIYAHFGVKSSDKRLQRPEFIGSSRSNVTVSEVMQTSSPQSELDTPQANMSGAAVQVGSSRNFHYYAEEHGYIMGLCTVIPDTAYYQGVPRHWSKINDRLQYYFPEFAHLGEQEIKNRELFAPHNEPDGTFGYIPRYSEYRYINSRVSGDFVDTLKFWHMGRDFEDIPVLNSDFISSDPTKRIFAVQSLPDDGEDSDDKVRDFHSLYAHIFHSVKANRLMPKYGTPNF